MSQTISRMFGVFALLSLALSIGALSLAATRSGTVGSSGAAGLPGTNGGQGPAGPQGSQGPPGTSWKTGNYTHCALDRNPASVTNCASLSFTAPQNGFIWLQSSGYCHTPQGPVSTQILIGWSPQSSSTPKVPSAVYFSHITGEPLGVSQESYAVSAVFSVVAGSQTYYLNASNYFYPIGSTSSDTVLCFGTNILMFTTTQLS